MRQAKAKMQRMVVQILWTPGVFCGTPDKTRPEQKIEPGREGKKREKERKRKRENEKRSSALSTSIRGESLLPQKRTRPGPATQTAFVRAFLLALSPLGGGR
jgi:hypothetical protein